MKQVKHIPKFKSEQEEAKFWETHSVTDYLHELKEFRNIKFPKPRKRLISVRMDDSQIKPLDKFLIQPVPAIQSESVKNTNLVLHLFKAIFLVFAIPRFLLLMYSFILLSL